MGGMPPSTNGRCDLPVHNVVLTHKKKGLIEKDDRKGHIRIDAKSTKTHDPNANEKAQRVEHDVSGCIPCIRALGMNRPNSHQPLHTLVPQHDSMDLRSIALVHMDVIFHMMTNIPLVRECYLHWYQLQQIGEWTHWATEWLGKMHAIEVTIDADLNDVTVKSVVWLHEWATSVNHRRRLRCIIPCWTVAIQRGFARAKHKITMCTSNNAGLHNFSLAIESVDPGLMKNARWVLDNDLIQGEMIWGRFINVNTHIAMTFHVANVDTWTIRWFESMLQAPVCYGKGMVTHMSLDCPLWDSTKMYTAICNLVWNYTEKKAFKIYHAYQKNPKTDKDTHTSLADYDLISHSDHECALHMHVMVPKHDIENVKIGICNKGTTFDQLVRQQMIDRQHITMNVSEQPQPSTQKI
jgi:hypothetical protein